MSSSAIQRQVERDAGPHVVKVGGSLLDLPDLPARFAAHQAGHFGARCLVVVGGGEAAESVRRFDARHGLDQTTGHWLAVRGMQLNAMMLAEVLEGAVLVHDPRGCERAWGDGGLAVMEPVAWLEDAERAGDGVPHLWQFTSDSIAAHAAHRLGACRLTLLKSTLPAGDREALAVEQAAAEGVVDEQLPGAAKGLARVELVNLRAEPRGGRWPSCVLQVSP